MQSGAVGSVYQPNLWSIGRHTPRNESERRDGRSWFQRPTRYYLYFFICFQIIIRVNFIIKVQGASMGSHAKDQLESEAMLDFQEKMVRAKFSVSVLINHLLIKTSLVD